MSDEGNLAITNTLFPPPPSFYQSFTETNLERYVELKRDKGKARAESDVRMIESSREDETKELDGLERELEKPRVDWVKQDERWMCFGQMYTVGSPMRLALPSLHSTDVFALYIILTCIASKTELSIPTAASLNIPPLIDPDEPPGTSLPPLLHSFLHTLFLLVDTLTNTSRIPGELAEVGWAHEGDQYIQHLSNLAATMMVSANQLRGVQAGCPPRLLVPS